MIKIITEKSILKQIGFFPDPSVAKYEILWDKKLCLNNDHKTLIRYVIWVSKETTRRSCFKIMDL